MAYTFNPFTGQLDFWTNIFGQNGIVLTDSNGVQWRVTVDTTGHLVTTQLATAAGTPIGLLLALTHAT